MKNPICPPGPKSRFFGLDLQLASQRDHLGFMERARDYGDIVHFKIGQRDIYLLNHPDHIKSVLLTNQDNFIKGRGITRTDNFLGEGLLTSEGTFHQRQRKLTQPAFSHERVAAYAGVMTKLASDVSGSWMAGNKLNVLKAMRQITLPIASQTLFGRQGDFEQEEIISAFLSGLSGFRPFKSSLTSMTDRLSLLERRRLRQARSTLEKLISRFIVERRQGEDGQGDLLSLLLSRSEEEDERLRDVGQIRNEAVTLFIGSFENVATALTWTWYLLAKHPAVEAKLHGELNSVLGDRPPCVADLPQLGYTRMVFDEAMRVYPPVPRLVRTAIRDHQVGAYTIPAGSLVVVSQYLMHRDPRYYPEPAQFDPERWTQAAKQSRPGYSYFPFGGGARRCIGEGFAYMEGVLVLATLASHWRLTLASRSPVELTATHFLHPKRTLWMVPKRKGASE